MLDSSLVSLGNEFDATGGQFYSAQYGFPKVLGLKDGSYVISWEAICSSTSATGIILRFTIFYSN